MAPCIGRGRWDCNILLPYLPRRTWRMGDGPALPGPLHYSSSRALAQTSTTHTFFHACWPLLTTAFPFFPHMPVPVLDVGDRQTCVWPGNLLSTLHLSFLLCGHEQPCGEHYSFYFTLAFRLGNVCVVGCRLPPRRHADSDSARLSCETIKATTHLTMCLLLRQCGQGLRAPWDSMTWATGRHLPSAFTQLSCFGLTPAHSGDLLGSIWRKEDLVHCLLLHTPASSHLHYHKGWNRTLAGLLLHTAGGQQKKKQASLPVLLPALLHFLPATASLYMKRGRTGRRSLYSCFCHFCCCFPPLYTRLVVLFKQGRDSGGQNRHQICCRSKPLWRKDCFVLAIESWSCCCLHEAAGCQPLCTAAMHCYFSCRQRL